MSRRAETRRTTGETDVRAAVDLDGAGIATVSTGVGFFDHMLTLFARHSLIDVEVDARGDLETGSHHTVEDVGITLGQALAKALGDKKGIRRFGHAYVPLDEALTRVVIDFSGRPGLEFVFTDAGAKKMAAATGANLGKRIAFVVGDKVIVAPRLVAKIEKRAQVSGNFSRERVEQLAAQFQQRAKK